MVALLRCGVRVTLAEPPATAWSTEVTTNALPTAVPWLTDASNSPAASPQSAKFGSATGRRMDSLHDRVSACVRGFGRGVDRVLHGWITPEAHETSETIDRFFGDRGDSHELDGRSCLRISPGITLSRADGVKFRGRFRLSLNVPQFNDRLQVVASSYSTEDDVLPGVTDLFSRQGRGPVEDDESAGLRLILANRLNYGLDTGVSLRFRPEPVPKLKLRGELRHQTGGWMHRLQETGFWRSDDGFGEKTELIQAYTFSDRLVLTGTQAVLWEESEPGLTLGVTVSLRRRLRRDRELGVTAAVESSTEPSHAVTAYALRVPYRRYLHRDWMRLKVEPGLNFEKERDFTPDPIITVALELSFGDLPKRK